MKKSQPLPENELPSGKVKFSVLMDELKDYVNHQTDAEKLLEAVNRLDPNLTFRDYILKMEELRKLNRGEN